MFVLMGSVHTIKLSPLKLLILGTASELSATATIHSIESGRCSVIFRSSEVTVWKPATRLQ